MGIWIASTALLNLVLKLREQHRFMKGLFAWIGFPAIAVRYDRAPRAAGTTKWNYWKLWNFSLEGITSFTVAPLKIATYIGLITAATVLAVFLVPVFFLLVRSWVQRRQNKKTPPAPVAPLSPQGDA